MHIFNGNPNIKYVCQELPELLLYSHDKHVSHIAHTFKQRDRIAIELQYLIITILETYYSNTFSQFLLHSPRKIS